MGILPRARGDRRGQTELIGTVLLFGFVLVGIVSVLTLSSMVSVDVSNSIESRNAEHTMREADSQIGQVAYNAAGVNRTIDFTGLKNQVRVTPNGNLTVSVVNGTETCAQTLQLGSIETTTKDGEKVAYQAGGVWKHSPSGSSMVSPPDIKYQNGTFSLDVVNVANGPIQTVDSVKVAKNLTETRRRNQQHKSSFSNPACLNPDNITLTVDSNYADAWGRFFKQHIGGTVTYLDDETVSVTVVQAGSTAKLNQQNNTVSATNFEATIEVLGTELSSHYDGDKRSWPITMRVLVNDVPKTPWKNGNVNDPITVSLDDVNDPRDGESFTYSLSREDETTIYIEATSYNCNFFSFDDAGFSTNYDGTWYNEMYCANPGSEDINISSSDDTSNLVILTDGEKVPDFNAAGPEQRGLSEVLQGKVNQTGYLTLQPNEFVYLYELSKSNANPANAGGSGDPDYNDAIVLLTITEDGSSEQPENFLVHINENTLIIRSN